MRKSRKNRKVLLYLVVILGLTIGFALISTTLKINGFASIKSNTWDIHWDSESINVSRGSVSANDPVVSTTNSTNDTVSFGAVFDLPGDYYEFEIDAVNAGGVDGALSTISTIVYNASGEEITGDDIPDYLKYSIKYSDGSTPQNGDVLRIGRKKTYKIRVEYDDSDSEGFVEEAESYQVKVLIPYVQSKSNCPAPVSFSSDSWDTIACNVRKGNTDSYNIGDTKSVDLGSFGTHTVRISNKSTPSECSGTGFSQTACGFVVEFTDSIINHRMNPYLNNGSVVGDGNNGGWEHSEMRTYVNNDIYNAFPSDLKDAIIETSVISSRGSYDSSNFTTIDKVYLLAYREVWIVAGSDSMNDTSYNDTRQLDYYLGYNTTTQNYSAASKDYGSTQNFWWWLRSADVTSSLNFYYVMGDGMKSVDGSYGTAGVSPAFRIG